MAKLSDFIPQSEIDDYLENSEDLLEGKLELAREVVEYARSISPEDTGEYKAGIKVRRYGRAGVGVVWTDPKSNIIEYGTEDTPEFAVRARTEAHFNHPGSGAL
ncbi:hypothetical protein [Mycobacterium intracellulare]|uniref:HK97 gp10 family phage protein n=1 Tax=Mycobacterium intracellulare TaxID=1767 RepID=A0AAE4RG12_MYCIT|nr:hypothetical protein [Mycobacterium intracellulare]MDV6979655.1 hypothetical protein [Mycobacterium intracellulare]MDV6985158.1 hypothetical protein [Mycobacterium intracellulare]MDV7014222.1 hypothetical protein [Mycobacterium intracellulare]MDV7030149.1 hypothetical protein [Mycobacterium intracellulare]